MDNCFSARSILILPLNGASPPKPNRGTIACPTQTIFLRDHYPGGDFVARLHVYTRNDTVIRCLNTDISRLGNVGEFFLIRGMPRPLTHLNWKNIALGAVIVAGAVALSFYSNKKLDRLKRERDAHGVFVVGTALGESNDLKGALLVDYAYTFSGRVYRNSMATDRWLDGGHGAQRRRFYVRVAVGDPGNSELLLDHPIPDSIVRSPDSGWVRMPGDSSRQ